MNTDELEKFTFQREQVKAQEDKILQHAQKRIKKVFKKQYNIDIDAHDHWLFYQIEKETLFTAQTVIVNATYPSGVIFKTYEIPKTDIF